MKYKAIVEYEYPVEHKPPVKAEIILHGDRVITDNIKWVEQEPKTVHWIPVNERLPENGDLQIITILDEWGDYPFRYSDFGWYLEAAKCWIVGTETRTDIVAWMPLPKPYMEVEE